MVIDFEHHWLPEDLWRARAAGGKYGKPAPFHPQLLCQTARHLEDMAAAGVDVTVLSCRVYSVEESRACNNGLAELQRRYPGRIVGLAPTLALGGRVALDEMERAVKELGLKGVSIDAQEKGFGLDYEEFWPFYERAAELGVPVFIHPPRFAKGFDALTARYDLQATIGWEYSLSLAIARLIAGGVMEAFPDIQFVIAHFGGGAAASMDRLDSYILRWKGRFWDSGESPLKKPFFDYFNRLYLDMAGYSGGMNAVNCALTIMSPSRLVFATDYPFSFGGNPQGIKAYIDNIRSLPLDSGDKEAMLGGNAAQLLGL